MLCLDYLPIRVELLATAVPIEALAIDLNAVEMTRQFQMLWPLASSPSWIDEGPATFDFLRPLRPQTRTSRDALTKSVWCQLRASADVTSDGEIDLPTCPQFKRQQTVVYKLIGRRRHCNLAPEADDCSIPVVQFALLSVCNVAL